METMTIARALNELTLLDKRINKNTNDLHLIEAIQNNKKIYGNYTEEEFSNNALNDYKSVIDLIERRNKIKCAIVKSNAIKNITINGKEMTVAEGLERKSSIEYEQNLLNKMRKQFVNANDVMMNENERVAERLQRLIEINFSKDSKDSNKDDIDTITTNFNKKNEWKVIDPLKLDKKIKELELELDSFNKEIKFILAESNTITNIEF